ncbi:MAG: SIS domain-containing protein [Candidatus Scalindua sp.]|jgi:D-sedoheptulose 7-phosphate isomerase|nr:SIS domain-containing protein [Candidatus Scalindua sp.]MBT6228314.1 SIS domain-containing protein [Candidatus Scalindua sp.]
MEKLAEDYYKNILSLIGAVRVTDKEGKVLEFYHGIKVAGNLILSHSDHKMMFIGNGASASISSHMATDFWKNGRIEALAFNDSSLLTCISNDYGYEHVFEKPIEMFAKREDIVFAISSSGESKNIVRGVNAARLKECSVITLSGFKDDNILSTLGDINFYIPSRKYGLVEVIHHSICHCILDTIVSYREGQVKEWINIK